MKKSPKRSRAKMPAVAPDGMRADYDFRAGVRNKYGLPNGVHVIVLDPDLAAAFPDAKSVSRALRAYLKAKPKRRTA